MNRTEAFRQADKELKEKIGTLVRRLRLAKGWSQEDLADELGLHTNYIGHVERGEKMVTVGALRRIVTPLEMGLSDFFAWVEE